MLTVLSLGGGVQSSCLALMAAEGELPRPDAAVFADTRAESRHTYAWLDWLAPQLPYPVYRVSAGNLLDRVLQPLRQGSFAALPVYTPGLNGDGPGQLRRQCTSQFKLDPIRVELRRLLGIGRGQRSPKEASVVLWLGISLDEVYRMRPNREAWIENRWPLVDARMTRADCIRWMAEHGYNRPPRSACVCCPYRSDREWRDLRDTDSEGWAKALDVDNRIRGGIRGNSRPLYLHRSCRPLEDVDLSTETERGQLSLWAMEVGDLHITYRDDGLSEPSDDHGDLCDGHCFV